MNRILLNYTCACRVFDTGEGSSGVEALATGMGALWSGLAATGWHNVCLHVRVRLHVPFLFLSPPLSSPFLSLSSSLSRRCRLASHFVMQCCKEQSSLHKVACDTKCDGYWLRARVLLSAVSSLRLVTCARVRVCCCRRRYRHCVWLLVRVCACVVWCGVVGSRCTKRMAVVQHHGRR